MTSVHSHNLPDFHVLKIILHEEILFGPIDFIDEVSEIQLQQETPALLVFPQTSQ